MSGHRWVAAPERAVDRGAPRASSRPRRGNGIPALDGIRALAVALVLADHGGIPGVPGGFIGVDVFFVLSGFLITSLLLDELGRTGGIDLPGFWVRRARRLLPALIVVVMAVVVLRELFPSDAIAAVRDDAVAAFFWVANWVFVFRDTDYFTQGDTPSPLQHTWSLAVEEQYYLVWPLVLVAVAVLLALLTRRRPTRPKLRTVRMVIVGIAVAGAAASGLASCLMVSDASLNRVYFGTDTRVQALLVGAAAAALLVHDWSALARYGTQIRARWGRWIAQILPVIGLTMLGVVAHFATGSAPEFRRGLLIVVAVAAVLIVAPVALEQRGLVARMLAVPPLVWLGMISYGVYLWHWPIFLALNGERTGLTGMPLFAIRAVATVTVAAMSWWLIEQPIKRWRPAHRPATAARGGDAGDRGRRDDGRGAGRHQTGRRRPSRTRRSGRRRAAGSAGRDRGDRAACPRNPHGGRFRGLDGVDHDALSAADARVQVRRLHHHRLRHRARRAVSVDR